MRIRALAFVGAFVGSLACAPVPRHHATTMEALPPPPPAERQSFLVAQDDAVTIVAPGIALVTADDPSIVAAYVAPDTVSLIGKTMGKTVLHLKRAGKPDVDVDVEVAAPKPNHHALAIGETVAIPTGNIRQYSDSGPGIVDLTATSDGKQFLVTGRRAGRHTVLFVDLDGTGAQHQFVVVAGDRHF